MRHVLLPYVEESELARLQEILDRVCRELEIQTTPETRHLREFLARQLVVLRDSEDLSDDVLSARLTARARFLGIRENYPR